MDSKPQKEDFPFPPLDSLLTAMRDGQYVIFLGAGAGKSAGLPDGKALSNLIAQHMRGNITDLKEKEDINKIKDNLQEIAEKYKNRFGESELKNLVCKIIEEKEENADPAIYQWVAKLPPCDIITTNYDCLLESSFDSPYDHDVFFKEEHMHRTPNVSTNIYKIHGSRVDPGSIIITKDDFDVWLNPDKYQAFKDKLRVLFREKVVLFVGYSAEDQNFRVVFKSVSNEKARKPHYFVSRHEDIWREEEWERYGFKFIHSDAEEFFKKILSLYEKFSKEFAEIKKEEASFIQDKNPFRYISAENVKKGEEEIIARYFIEPLGHLKITEPGQSTVIEGNRGSGKSWILRYLAHYYEGDIKNIAFYIKCIPEGFMATRRVINEDIPWFRFFIHYFNLFILSAVCHQLVISNSDNEKKFCEAVSKLLYIENGNVSTLFTLIDRIYTLTDICTAGAYNKINFTSPSVLYRFFEKLQLYSKEPFENVYILLDEFDNLSEDQQKVINVLLRGRNAPQYLNFNLNFKIGVKSGCMVFRDISNALLRLDHDYYYVSLDKFTNEEKEKYIEFIRKIGNRRLEKEGYNLTDVKLLLPPLEYESQAELKYIGKDYSGFRNYVYLSSGIVRDFISLVKDTLYTAYPDISYKKVELKPIPSKVQNHVIKIKSALHYRNYEEDISEPEKVRKLIDILGELFRSILNLSINNYNEKVRMGEDPIKAKDNIRRVSQIGIDTTHSKLDDKLKEILDQAIEVQLLQVPLSPRQPQLMTGVPHKNYKFHRLLIPYFELALQNRHPRNIKSEIFNLILIDKDRFLKELMKKWDEYAPPSQTILEYDWGEVG